jgi:hypothetical protein
MPSTVTRSRFFWTTGVDGGEAGADKLATESHTRAVVDRKATKRTRVAGSFGKGASNDAAIYVVGIAAVLNLRETELMLTHRRMSPTL